MVVLVMSWELSIPGAGSLKEKRMVVRSMKDRMRNKFNVSVAETDFHDTWSRAELTVALVASDRRRADSVGDSVDKFVAGERRAVITGSQRDML